jgi:hypothetical protein
VIIDLLKVLGSEPPYLIGGGVIALMPIDFNAFIFSGILETNEFGSINHLFHLHTLLVSYELSPYGNQYRFLPFFH